jgi:hypothetical protein
MSDQQHQKMSQHRLIFHFCYATVVKAVDERYDVPGYMLSALIKICLKNRATIPRDRRVYYGGYVQQEAFTYLEAVTAGLLFGPNGRFSLHEYRYRLRI